LSAAFFDADKFSALRSLSYDVSPVRDDKPFFKYLSLGFFDHGGDKRFETLETRPRHQNRILIRMAVILATLTALGFVFFLRLRRHHAVSLALQPALYFASIGFGFIVLEQNIIHRLLKVTGSTHYAFAIGLFSLLASAGVGSIVSQRFKNVQKMFVSLLVCGALYQFSIAEFSNFLLSLESHLALALCFFYLIPLGFLLGMPFSMGLRQWELTKSSVATAWFLNGIFTAIGSYLGFLIALQFGFSWEGWFGILSYAIGLMAISISTKAAFLKVRSIT
jgi:hypothetical protein